MSRRQFGRHTRDPHDPADDAGCTILHIDLDAFFASASLRSRPDLRGRPVIVGGAGGRGVVLSATYEARRRGVASAMPMSRALRLCPQATVLPPDFEVYQQISRGVQAIFRDVTPEVEPLSIDEAFLDVAGALRLFGSPAQIGHAVRARIEAEHGVTASVGVAPTKFVAKLASNLAKPDGLLVVPVDEVVQFLHPLPVAALWGVGDRTEERLIARGYRTIADLAHQDPARLRADLGGSLGAHLFELSWGRDSRSVVRERRERSIGADETFATDLHDPADLHRELLRLAQRTAGRVRRAGLVGRTISIRVRFSDFRTISRSRTLAEPTDTSRVVFETARELFDAIGLRGEPLRLVGVRMEGLTERSGTAVQGMLGEREHGWSDADRAIDAATERFGAGVVRPAALVAGRSPALPGRQDRGTRADAAPD